MSFEKLWEKSENYHKNDNSDISSLIDELTIKLNFYKGIDQKIEIPKEEKDKAKHLLLGEILFIISNISLKDDINIYSSLNYVLDLNK